MTFRYLGRGYASQTAAARRLTTAGQLCAFRVRSCGRLGRVTGRMVTSGVVLGGGAWSIALDRSNTILCSRLGHEALTGRRDGLSVGGLQPPAVLAVGPSVDVELRHLIMLL